MKHLKFSNNWNNKLECRYFTTLRISKKFEVNDRVIVTFKNKFKFARIMEVRKIRGQDLNNFICYLDTGYNLEATQSIIIKMYNLNNWSEVNHMYLYLVEAEKVWQEFSIDDVVLDITT